MSGIRRKPLQWFFVAMLFVLSVLSVNAQAAPTPITLGQNLTGQISDTSSAITYSVTVGAPQSVNIQVLAVTPGFAPTFRVLDPGGVVVFDTANPGTQPTAQASPNLSSTGTYTIEVRAASSTLGQFLISLQAGAPLAPPTPLIAGQPMDGSVDAQTTRQAYSFSASSSDVLLLAVVSALNTSGPVVTLRDADSGATLSLNSARLAGLTYRIASGTGNYLVEVTSDGSATPEAFTVCLATESGATPCRTTLVAAVPTLTPILQGIVPTPTVLTQPASGFTPAQIDPNGPCEAASAQGAVINVRSGPGTNYNVITKLAPTLAVRVIGRAPDASWYQISVANIVGWVSATVMISGGNCAGVSAVLLPTAVPPSNPPSAAPTQNQPTNHPTHQPSDTPTTAPTSAPSAIPTNAEFKINTALAPTSGTVNLEAGNSITVGVIVDGNINDENETGSYCPQRFVTGAAPDLNLHYTNPNGLLHNLKHPVLHIDPDVDTYMTVFEGSGNSGGTLCQHGKFALLNAYYGDYHIWIDSQEGFHSTVNLTIYTTTS